MMTKNPCDYENAVVKSLKSSVSTDEISTHLQACADCQETARVVLFFQSNLKKESPPKPLPTAGLIWFKSNLRKKQLATERAGQPILIVQTVAAIVFSGAFIWLYSGGWLNFLAIDRLLDSIDKIFVPLFAATVCFLFLCLILILTLRRYFLEK